MSTPIDREKLLSIGLMHRTPTVREGRRADGVRVKRTVVDEQGSTITEHASKDERVDCDVHPATVTLKIANGG